MCGPHRRFAPLLPRTLRRIPQAVSTVATHPNLVLLSNGTLSGFNTASGRHCYFITFVFPSFQSGTRDVWTSSSFRSSAASHPSSHTANGKYCCNFDESKPYWWRLCRVSIPQAVSTVATNKLEDTFKKAIESFNTASDKHCCNEEVMSPSMCVKQQRFNTASGRYCYFITFVFPSLRSGTRDVRASSSLRSSAASHPSSHTASGRYCCNHPRLSNKPQNRKCCFNTASGKCCCNIKTN